MEAMHAEQPGTATCIQPWDHLKKPLAHDRVQEGLGRLTCMAHVQWLVSVWCRMIIMHAPGAMHRCGPAGWHSRTAGLACGAALCM